ncbi:hypothetical protein DFH27DRAFT_553843 [Peziza echinospora]|nr:hypothetical protein DFH27DRAFT_553843 [Peziza echinospora]
MADHEYIVNQHPAAVKQSSNWSFTQGLLIGQLSVIIVLSAFIRFFIFGEPSENEYHRKSLLPSTQRGRDGGKHHPHDGRVLRKKRSSLLRPSTPLTTTTILEKTYYNVDSHQHESLDWFNVLVAQAIAQFRDDARTDNAILTSLDTVLNGPNNPKFLDRIKVTEVNLGDDFPIFSNCRICPVDSNSSGGAGEGKVQARMNVDLSDLITLGIETRLLLNYPKPLVAVLPVALAVSIVRFSGTLSISFVPSPAQPPQTENGTTPPPQTSTNSTLPPASQSTTLQFSFSDDYRLDISVRSLVGSRSRLQDVPKIAQLVESRLHNWIDERCVEPRFQQIVLPSLWPRKKTTREGGGAGVGGGASADGSSGAAAGSSSGVNIGGGGAGGGVSTAAASGSSSAAGELRNRAATSTTTTTSATSSSTGHILPSGAPGIALAK